MESKYKYKFTVTATYEMASSVEYIRGKLYNNDASIELAKNINDAVNDVCDKPKLNHDCKYYGIDDENTRYIKVGNYNLFYHIDEKNRIITFLRFLYSKMNIKKKDIKEV